SDRRAIHRQLARRRTAGLMRAIKLAALLIATMLTAGTAQAEPACVYGAWDTGVATAAGWKFSELWGDEFQMALHVAERDAGLMHGVTAHIYAMARQVPGNSGEMQYELAFLDRDGCFRLRLTTNH